MKYAVFFLACSVGLVVVAFPWTASSVLKLWGSLALGVVGLGYAGVGPRIFGKGSDGRMRPLNVLILAPYLLLLWSVWHLSRALRRESPFNELVEGITIGRRLLPGEYPEGIESVVDLTAEFPASSRIRQGRNYRAFPILDGHPPRPRPSSRSHARSWICRATCTSTVRRGTVGRPWSLLPFCWLAVTCGVPPKRSLWCSSDGLWPG